MNEVTNNSFQSRRPDHFARWERVRERLAQAMAKQFLKHGCSH